MSRHLVRGYCLIVTCVILLNGVVLAQDVADWTKFESKEFKFTVEFPQAHVERSETDNATHFFTPLPGTDTDFRVGVSDVPSQPENNELLIAELERIRDAVAETFQTKAEQSKIVDDRKQRGLQFDLKLEMEGHRLIMSCRYFIVNKKLYQIMVVRLDGVPLREEIKHFFDSFVIDG